MLDRAFAKYLKIKSLFLIAALLVAAAVFLFSDEHSTPDPHFITPPTLSVGKSIFEVEVVSSAADRKLGLGGRTSLGEKKGMLFVFPKVDYHGIWMKDLLFNLDIMWINEDGEVISIERDIHPDTYPEVFAPERKAKYVLEVNAKALNKITLGERVILNI